MLLKGDCRQQLATLPDNSVHAIITDPPYELGFMGKTWDSTGIAYNVEVWQQCLRVLKPGGHLLAFGGSRTYHRLACAIEDAGFEIRDQIMWVYGSGFPKSLDVSKAIDKAAGVEREVTGIRKVSPSDLGQNSGWNKLDTSSGEYEYTAPSTDAAKQWDGWGTALKPAHEPIVLARKPLNGTVANNVLTHGVGALNINDCRVDYNGEKPSGWFDEKERTNAGFKLTAGSSSIITSVPSTGRWPANFIHDGSDEVLQLFPDSKGAFAPVKSGHSGKSKGIYGDYAQRGDDGATFYGDSGSAARFFYCAKASRTERNTGLDELEEKQTTGGGGLTVVGGAYGSIKAKQQNFHPTVKPLALIHYLIKLITPPGGTILDPFLGSGTTAVAATQLGHPWIGCELTEDYWPIIQARIAHATPLT
jgi:DNA modification methylase